MWVLLNHAEIYFLFDWTIIFIPNTVGCDTSRHISRPLHFLFWVWQIVRYCIGGIWWSLRSIVVILFVVYTSVRGSWLNVAHQPPHICLSMSNFTLSLLLPLGAWSEFGYLPKLLLWLLKCLPASSVVIPYFAAISTQEFSCFLKRKSPFLSYILL